MILSEAIFVITYKNINPLMMIMFHLNTVYVYADLFSIHKQHINMS